MSRLVIRGGHVVDGTSVARVRADVVVEGATVILIGQDVAAHGSPCQAGVDADGMVGAPGFVDVHTHLNAQLLWELAALPSVHADVASVRSQL